MIATSIMSDSKILKRNTLRSAERDLLKILNMHCVPAEDYILLSNQRMLCRKITGFIGQC